MIKPVFRLLFGADKDSIILAVDDHPRIAGLGFNLEHGRHEMPAVRTALAVLIKSKKLAAVAPPS
jgi:hypothetical protein